MKSHFFCSICNSIYPNGRSIIMVWREADGAKLWRFSLTPHGNQVSPTKLDTQEVMLSGFSACDLTVMEVLVHYLHATDGFSVKSMWLYTIKSGNYATWPGTTFYNADKYFPESRETIKCHMFQTFQISRSTKPKPAKSTPAKVSATETPITLLPSIPSI